jgi:hypothetical protein
MNPEANFSSGESTQCTDAITHSLLAVPMTFKGAKLGVLAVFKKNWRGPLYRREPYNSRDSGIASIDYQQ